MALDILVVDDESDIRMLMSGILTDEGYECRVAADSKSALAALEQRLPNLVILDIWLHGSDLDGLGLLDLIKREHAALPVIMISGHGTIETAVNSIKLGAYDFIEKPFKADRLLHMVARALDIARLERENEELRQRAGVDDELIGQSPSIGQLRSAIERVAPTDSRVLIGGPAGAGKEVVARLIHQKSRRHAAPFVVLNCATMAPDRMELELFGQRGNGANGTHRTFGTFERANGGTLLLDEVSDMPLETQGKIVRLLQEQTFTPIGGTSLVSVDVRVLASSNRSLKEECDAGRFRPDLYYRLSVVPLSVPPLSARREDIPALADHFMQRASTTSGLPVRRIADDAMAALQSYAWPGNVRQLRNVVEWLLIMASGEPGEAIRAEMLPPEIHDGTPGALRWDEGSALMGLPLREAREIFERQYLISQVNRFGGNISRTASFVGMERSALHRKLKSLGVTTNDKMEETAGT